MTNSKDYIITGKNNVPLNVTIEEMDDNTHIATIHFKLLGRTEPDTYRIHFNNTSDTENDVIKAIQTFLETHSNRITKDGGFTVTEKIPANVLEILLMFEKALSETPTEQQAQGVKR
jgi:hypothetical protein